MYGTTTGKDIFDTFTEHFEERGIEMKKIFSEAIDDAPAMIGQHRGFVNLIEQKIRHPVMKLHCIVHQENLCAKISNSVLNDVMSTVLLNQHHKCPMGAQGPSLLFPLLTKTNEIFPSSLFKLQFGKLKRK